jgi:hypothetical protein
MPKKQKRNVSQRAVATKTRAVATGTRAASKATPVGAYASSPRPMTSMDFNPDFTFVKQDLKRIGITAASFIAVLIVLSFFLK